MTAFLVVHNKPIPGYVQDGFKFVVSKTKLNFRFGVFKALKTNAHINQGLVMFDNSKEAFEFAHNFTGYVTDLRNEEIIGCNFMAETFNLTRLRLLDFSKCSPIKHTVKDDRAHIVAEFNGCHYDIHYNIVKDEYGKRAVLNCVVPRNYKYLPQFQHLLERVG